MAKDTVENSELVSIARDWLRDSDPSKPPSGSWRLTSKNIMSGKRRGQAWLYAELQRADHDEGWRAILQAVDLDISYSNSDGNLINE